MLLNQLIKEGKSKTVFSIPDAGAVILQYKDTLTGHSDGIPDPGGNQVVGSIPESGRKYLDISLAFYQVLENSGLPVARMERIGADQLKVEVLDLVRVEVICRNRATGSFVRRYSPWAHQGQSLNGLIEFTLKDDSAGDPLIVEDALVLLGLLDQKAIEEVKSCTSRTNDALLKSCATLGIELWDFKLEFGRRQDGILVLRDELSPRTARFYRAGSLLGVDELHRLLEGYGLVS
jgi:phosphoribosylaminoimidazole-succinocarboxamide synthase